MRLKLFPALLQLSLLATAGFAQDVRYNFDRNADFSQYKTYRWVQIKGAAQASELADQQIKSAIDAELSKKGLTSTHADADLLIGYQPAIRQETEYSSYSSGFGPGWGYGAGWGGGWGGSSITTGQTSTIHIGSIGLDIYDASKQKLIWRGGASKALNTTAKPEKVQKNLMKAIAKLLKNYPPPLKR